MPEDVHSGRSARLPPRWLRSVRDRPSAFATLLAMSALAVAVAVLMPLLLRSIAEASFAQTLAASEPLQHGFAVEAQLGDGVFEDAEAVDDQAAEYAAADGVWQRPVTWAVSTTTHVWASSTSRAESSLVVLPPGCPHLHFVSGRCPLRSTEVAIGSSQRRALGTGAVQDDTVKLVNDQSTVLTVVGVYDDSGSRSRDVAQPTLFAGTGALAPASALVVGDVQVEKLGIDFQIVERVLLREPARLEDESTIRKSLNAVHRALVGPDSADYAVRLVTALPTTLDRLAQDRAAAIVLGSAIGIEALVIAWFAMAVVVGRVSRVRAVEWGIGRTRGVPRRRWIAEILVEPGIAIVLGAALGTALGVGIAALVARIALGPLGTVDPAQPLVWAAVGLALGGSAVALGAASLRSARLPLPDLLRRTTEPRRLTRVALVAQSGAVLVTATVVWSVLTQNQVGAGQVALLAPTLVALVIALGVLRLAVVVVRRRTAVPSRSLAGLVVGRQLARAPSALSPAVIVAIGVALAVCSLQFAALSGRLAADEARVTVGASEVDEVRLDRGVDLLGAVDAADPTGRAAMAVEELTVGSGTDRVVAVDTSRLDAVTTWKAAWRGPDPAGLIRRLDPAIGTDLVITGDRVRIVLADVRNGDSPRQGMHLRVVLATDAQRFPVDLGPIVDGTLVSSPGAVPCTRGCRVVSIGSSSSAEDPSGVRFTVASISTDEQPASAASAWLTGGHRWRNRVIDQFDPTIPMRASGTPGPDGLAVHLEDRDGGLTPAIEPAAGPALLPALAGPSTVLNGFDGIPDSVFGIGLDRDSVLLHPIGRAAVLPRALGTGVLVDLKQIERVSDPGTSDPLTEVWLAPGDHRALTARLAAHGVHVVSSRTVDEETVAQARTADRRTLVLAPVVAALALLLALFALYGTRVAGAPAKARDWTSLRRTGADPHRIARMASLDVALPAAAGTVVGLVSGLAGYALVAGRLPLFPEGTAHPPPDFAPAPLALAVLALAAIAAVAAVSVLSIRFETGGTRD